MTPAPAARRAVGRRSAGAICAALAPLCLSSAAQASTPTFDRDVAPILFAHCAECHRPGGAGPMSLLTVDNARVYADRIRQKVAAREMPPWHADPRYGRFKNARVLTAREIDTVVAWIDGGMPVGAGAAPSPPAFPPDGWRVRLGRPPDAVLDLPFGELELPPTGEVPTFTVWMKLPFAADRFVQAIEMRPSVPNAVHHASLSLGPLPTGTAIGRAAVYAGGPVLEGVPVLGDGRAVTMTAAEQFGRPILFYVPGGGVLQLADGLAKRVRRDDYLAWGLHLVSPGRPAKLRVQVGLWFARRQPRYDVQTWTVNQTVLVEGRTVPADPRGGWRLPNIPPRAANWTVTGALAVDEDITVHALWPHMHARGKGLSFVLTHPNGKQETLLSVPRYNPHWQATYEPARPIRVRRGSMITAHAHYDNSAGNPHNPAPDAEVRFGPQSTDEMFTPFLEVTVDAENMRLQRLDEALR